MKSKAEPRPDSFPRCLPRLVHGLHVVLGIDIGLEVHVARCDKLGALDEFPDEDHADENGQFEVEADEVDGVEGWPEGCPPLDEYDEDVENDAEDWTPGVGPVFEGKQMLFPLCLESSTESERCNADTNPAQLVRHTNNIL